MDIIIGLIGAKGAGKTTAFNVLKELGDVQEITLAAKLKDVSASVFSIPREHFDSHRFKEKELNDPVFLSAENLAEVFFQYGIQVDFDKYVRPHVGKVLHTPRQVAQYIGTEVLRSHTPDIHCMAAVAGADKCIGVVTDLRFPNEFSFFSERYPNFHPVYIKNMRAEMAAGGDTHASEAYLKELAAKAEFVVSNNDSIKEFQDNVRKALSAICST